MTMQFPVPEQVRVNDPLFQAEPSGSRPATTTRSSQAVATRWRQGLHTPGGSSRRPSRTPRARVSVRHQGRPAWSFFIWRRWGIDRRHREASHGGWARCRDLVRENLTASGARAGAARRGLPARPVRITISPTGPAGSHRAGRAAGRPG